MHTHIGFHLQLHDIIRVGHQKAPIRQHEEIAAPTIVNALVLIRRTVLLGTTM